MILFRSVPVFGRWGTFRRMFRSVHLPVMETPAAMASWDRKHTNVTITRALQALSMVMGLHQVHRTWNAGEVCIASASCPYLHVATLYATSEVVHFQHHIALIHVDPGGHCVPTLYLVMPIHNLHAALCVPAQHPDLCAEDASYERIVWPHQGIIACDLA